MRNLMLATIAVSCIAWVGAMAQGSGPVKPIVVTAIKGDAARSSTVSLTMQSGRRRR